jgi:hypothetical protein
MPCYRIAYQCFDDLFRADSFNLRGVDSDNGREFRNFHLDHWLKQQSV